jgi:hypothetical protein
MDREPPLSVVCANLAKSAKNSLAKMFQNFQIFSKNIVMKFTLHIVKKYPFSLLKKDFCQKILFFWDFFIAKIFAENERFVSYIIVQYLEQCDFVHYWPYRIFRKRMMLQNPAPDPIKRSDPEQSMLDCWGAGATMRRFNFLAGAASFSCWSRTKMLTVYC